MLTPALRTLLDDARAEAKRAGHPLVTPLHLAAALARRAPAAFEAGFGAGATVAVRQRLAGSPPPGDEAETVALLESAGADDPAAVIGVLRARLGPLQAATTDERPAVPSGAPSPTPVARDGRLLARVSPDPGIGGFEALCDELLALLSMRTPATPLVHGQAGSGKSTVAAALAARLPDSPLAASAVLRLDTAAALSDDPVAALDQALDAQADSEIVVIDDLQSLLSLGAAVTTARALCEQLFGDEQRLVRLDMSEYAEEWALSRLIGPQPGYVGYSEPEAWLTTRIRKQPDTVLLLDEVEKAHRQMWNAFLQVFDAGRLTDARGSVADFQHTVIAMTSNLGAQAFGSAPIGFAAPEDGAQTATRQEQGVRDAVRRALPPELVNRLDEIVVFHPLSREAIAEIAALELERMRRRLAERGYAVAIGAGVAQLIAATGYDPTFGARHLQRNIERLLLEPLAALRERELTAEVSDGRIRWRAR